MFKHLGISIIIVFFISTAVITTTRGQEDAVVSLTEHGQVIQRTRRPSGGVTDYLPHAGDEILVRFRETASATAKLSAHSQHRTDRVKRFRNLENLELVKIPRNTSLESVVKSYRDNRNVLYAEPNYLIEALRVPNDTSFSSQWNLHNTGQNGGTPGADIKAVQAWDITTGSSDVVVAVVDTGIDYTHQDLTANMWRNEGDCNNNGIDDDGNGYIDDCYGIDAFNNDSDPMDDNNHGTHVAGIIGAVGNNGIGVTGISWNVKIMACKFIGADGFGTVADAIECLDYVQTLKDRGVTVVATNNSWGSYGYSHALFDAIDTQRQSGILFVASAGNNRSSNDLLPAYPASYYVPNLISVGATGPDGSPSFSSNWGETTLHLYAPGVNVLSTAVGNGYATLSGTSMAAPHVSGVAALLKAHDFSRDWRAIKNLLLSSGDMHASLASSITGKRLNAQQALACSNSTVLARVQPVNPILTIGLAPLQVSVIHINCANPNGEVNVVVNPGSQTVKLRDNGVGADKAPADGIYSAEWTPSNGGTFTLTFPDGDVVTLQVDADLKPGFPVKTLHLPGTYRAGPNIHTLVGNMDDDPNLEIVVTGLASGPLYAWTSTGSRVAGWPLHDFLGAGYAAMGNLSNDFAGDEIFAGHYATRGTLAAHSGSGANLPGWPRESVNFVGNPPALADIDGDGLDEIFIGEEDWLLHAYRADGTPLTGWPAALVPIGGQERHTPAIADLDGDGTLEVVTVSQTTSDGAYIFAYHRDGTLVNGFPISSHSIGRISFGAFLAIGDVDGDGASEIVAVSPIGSGLDAVPGVLVLSADGKIKRSIAAAGGISATAPALADLDGDGIPEIILQTEGALNVWRGDGSPFPGWPVIRPHSPEFGRREMHNSSPVVGDVDGDQLPDIVITGASAVWVYNRNGDLHPHFPKIIKIGMGGVPAIADIDRDGRNEIIITGSLWEGIPGEHSKVWVYDLGGPAHGAIEWGQFMGGPKHQGFYRSPARIPATATPRQVQFADVNGDGRADYLNFDLWREAELWVGYSNQSDFGTPQQWLQHGESTPDQIQYADVNGDGKADALYFDILRSRGVWVSLSTGSGFTPAEMWLQHGESTPDQIKYVDVNGDGKADALYFDTLRSKGVWVSLSTGSGFMPAEMWLQYGDSTTDQLQYADVNGDRRADALYFDAGRSNCVRISLSLGTGFTSPQPWLCHGPSSPDQIQYADLNGDGKADVLYFDALRSRGLWVSLSSGGGFTPAEMWLQHGESTTDQLQYADVNGDGKADALYFDTLRSRGVWVSLSTGSGFTPAQMWLQHGESSPDQIQYVDVNGDGKADAIYFDVLRSREVWVSVSDGSGFKEALRWPHRL